MKEEGGSDGGVVVQVSAVSHTWHTDFYFLKALLWSVNKKKLTTFRDGNLNELQL
jgi:hypothetical protein